MVWEDGGSNPASYPILDYKRPLEGNRENMDYFYILSGYIL